MVTGGPWNRFNLNSCASHVCECDFHLTSFGPQEQVRTKLFWISPTRMTTMYSSCTFSALKPHTRRLHHPQAYRLTSQSTWQGRCRRCMRAGILHPPPHCPYAAVFPYFFPSSGLCVAGRISLPQCTVRMPWAPMQSALEKRPTMATDKSDWTQCHLSNLVEMRALWNSMITSFKYRWDACFRSATYCLELLRPLAKKGVSLTNAKSLTGSCKNGPSNSAISILKHQQQTNDIFIRFITLQSLDAIPGRQWGTFWFLKKAASTLANLSSCLPSFFDLVGQAFVRFATNLNKATAAPHVTSACSPVLLWEGILLKHCSAFRVLGSILVFTVETMRLFPDWESHNKSDARRCHGAGGGRGGVEGPAGPSTSDAESEVLTFQSSCQRFPAICQLLHGQLNNLEHLSHWQSTRPIDGAVDIQHDPSVGGCGLKTWTWISREKTLKFHNEVHLHERNRDYINKESCQHITRLSNWYQKNSKHPWEIGIISISMPSFRESIPSSSWSRIPLSNEKAAPRCQQVCTWKQFLTRTSNMMILLRTGEAPKTQKATCMHLTLYFGRRIRINFQAFRGGAGIHKSIAGKVCIVLLGEKERLQHWGLQKFSGCQRLHWNSKNAWKINHASDPSQRPPVFSHFFSTPQLVSDITSAFHLADGFLGLPSSF